jgi:hypothetical protein
VRDTITQEGFSWVPLSSFQAADFEGLGGIMLRQGTAWPAEEGMDDGYSDAEIAAIQAFVQSGGGLIAAGEGGHQSLFANFNQLLGAWGVTLTGTALDTDGTIITDIVDHPVTTGLDQFAVDYYRPFTTVAPALDLTPTEHVLAVVEGTNGSGNVVVLADYTMWLDSDTNSDENIDSVGNRQLLQNALHWIMPLNNF